MTTTWRSLCSSDLEVVVAVVTTVLELVGAVAIVVGFALFVALWGSWQWPAAVVVFGAGLIGVSAIFTKAARR